ncbi:MAG TPA: hypothetical protein VLW54_05950 [Candidatus Acidoferrales bacterium]|nr:hypothetical protein [Candidatus Acidoferrales bacterium]
MILQWNHLPRKSSAASAQDIVASLQSLLEEGCLEPEQFASLSVQLDWIQYKQNFREAVAVIPCGGEKDGGNASFEVHVDLRQAGPGALRESMRKAIAPAHCGYGQPAAPKLEGLPLEDFQPFRTSIAWRFNWLYWQRLAEWEHSTGHGYEEALPGGKSDANHPHAVADGVADFWTLARDLEIKNQLPPELFVMEIGVGMGTRAGLWLDGFHRLDQERGTNYYPRVRFLLGDYSPATLERSKAAVRAHMEHCSFVVLDALNPMQTLSFLRHKILHIHMTNVYDNLPDEEMARRDGRLYLVEARAYLPDAEAERIAKEFGMPARDLPRCIERLLEAGPEHFAERARGVAFWQQVWAAMRLEERLVSAEDAPAEALPAELDQSRLEEVLKDAPSDLRFHVNSGALESMRNTLPLLSTRGYLQVQDIFVTHWNEYQLGFHGPGKLDGSIVNWVNGALLRETAERAGYDVHFAPFRYREGSRTSILFTTQRE